MYVNFTGWKTKLILETVYVLNPNNHVDEPQVAVFNVNVWFIVKDPDVPERIPFAAIQSSLTVVVAALIHDPEVRVDPEGHELQAVDAEEEQVWHEKWHLLQVTPAG